MCSLARTTLGPVKESELKKKSPPAAFPFMFHSPSEGDATQLDSTRLDWKLIPGKCIFIFLHSLRVRVKNENASITGKLISRPNPTTQLKKRA